MSETRRGSSMSRSRKPSAPTRTFWPPTDWSLRRKVVAALALPLIFATVLVGLRAADEWSSARSASLAEDRYAALKPSLAYLTAAQDLSAELVRSPRDTGRVAATRARFSKARNALRSSVDHSHLSARGRDLLQGAVSTGDTLAKGTPNSDAVTLAPGTIGSDVLAFVDDLDGIRPEATLGVLHDLITAQGHRADQRIDLSAATSLDGTLRAELAAGSGGERDALERVQSRLPTVDLSGLRSDTDGRIAFAGNGTLSQINGVTPSLTTSYLPIDDSVAKIARSRVADQAGDARRSALAQIGLILALLVLTGVLAALLSRRLLVQPVTGLRRRTIEASENDLPEAIARAQAGHGVGRIKSVALDSREEIGQLSRAIDGMQNRAIRLASQQASMRRQMTDMFETLSRRNTSLVNRQLNLLDQLEQDEDEPGRLDNLFALDHLAARMRRNGQSLMVLAGNEGPSTGREPLPLARIVAAATSEVQDYRRVDVGGLPDRWVQAGVATDLVHLVSELLDNALSYSAPHTRVEVSGTRAVDGGVLLEIVDHGLGMEPDVLAEHNESIAEGGQFGVDTARHMGLFVVGRLGAKHEITVRLRARSQSGVVAAVQVPAALLTEAPAAPRQAAPRPVTPPSRPHPQEERPAAPQPPTPRRSAAPADADRSAAPPDADRSAARELTDAGLPRRTPRTPDAARSAWVPPVTRPTTPATGEGRGASAFFSATRAARGTEPADEAPTDTGAPTPDAPGDRTAPAGGAVASGADATPARRSLADTPIFRDMSSRWLTADGAPTLPWSDESTDHAWAAARAATAAQAPESTDGTTLPRRTPGGRIVPGSVDGRDGRASEDGAGTGARDPEAIRAKLSRYKAGVERARQSSTDSTDADEPGSRPS